MTSPHATFTFQGVQMMISWNKQWRWKVPYIYPGYGWCPLCRSTSADTYTDLCQRPAAEQMAIVKDIPIFFSMWARVTFVFLLSRQLNGFINIVVWDWLAWEWFNFLKNTSIIMRADQRQIKEVWPKFTAYVNRSYFPGNLFHYFIAEPNFIDWTRTFWVLSVNESRLCTFKNVSAWTGFCTFQTTMLFYETVFSPLSAWVYPVAILPLLYLHPLHYATISIWSQM